MPIALDQNRTLPFTIAGQEYALTIKPIPRAAWLKYFDSIVVEDKLEEGRIVSFREVTPQRVDLLTGVLVDARGYEANGPTLPDNWPNLLPLAHRQAAADLLFEVGSGRDAFRSVPKFGSERSALAAFWSEEEKGKGIVRYDGLEHWFNMPSVEQQRRYSRDSSRSVVTGGRRGTTRYLGAQRTLAELYDELIVSVVGYSVGGKDLVEAGDNGKDLIVAHMDTNHKVQAMGAIFQSADPHVYEPETKEQ